LLFRSDGKIFNNAGQHWNHSFYWNCITPKQNEPSGELAQAIGAKWGSTGKFLEEFATQAIGNFGSGWTWLVKKGN
jgi:Fe-Mn family superoxide dismutase